MRRAASAAFQEYVGRQGHFEHDIEFITRLDYYGVSNLRKCFIQHCAFIAQDPAYPILLTEHLIENKVASYDPHLRELVSKALNRLTTFCPDHMVKNGEDFLLLISAFLTLYRREKVTDYND